MLTPFVRSDAQASILAEVFLCPDESVSLAELGRRTGVSAPVVHREVSRLIEANVLVDRYEGRNRLVAVNAEHPLFSLMSELIHATYGPLPVLREVFSELFDSNKVYIYGSWAARRSGQAGRFPNDIDVLVVGDATRSRLMDLSSYASQQLMLPVNVTRLSLEDWIDKDPQPFVATVRSRPLVDVQTGEFVA